MALSGMIYDEDPPSPYGPFTNPVDRFAHLSPSARKWLQGLDEEDIAELVEMQRGYRRAKTVGWFLKLIFWGSLAVFTAFATLGDKLISLWKSARGL